MYLSVTTRTAACLAIGPMDNGQGGWKFYNLLTARNITSNAWRVMELPESDAIIIQEIYDKDLAIWKVTDTDVQEVHDETLTHSTLSLNLVPSPHKNSGGENDAINFHDHKNSENENSEINSPESFEDVTGADIDAYVHGIMANHISDFHISLGKGIKMFGEAANEAITKEILMLHQKGTFVPVIVADLTAEARKSTIRCSLFFKEKFDATGAFVKLKARLVAGGNEQDTTLLSNISSPTLGTDKLFCLLAIAGSEGRHVAAVDIESAYLECDMEGPPVYMKLPPQISNLLSREIPSYTPYIDSKGCIPESLAKALYGSVQSAKLWHNKITNTLIELGFQQNPLDDCIFNKMEQSQVTVAVYVDDLLLTNKSADVVKKYIRRIGSKFSGYTSESGNVFGHLGVKITQNIGRCISVDMEHYTTECVEKWKPTREFSSPSDHLLFKDPDKNDQVLDHPELSIFHSAVASLLYLAKRTRPDILVVVSHLCSRVRFSTQKDWIKLDRVFGYLKKTIKKGFSFYTGQLVDPVIYTDASFNCHDDCKSRSGVLVMLSGGVVNAISKRQSILAMSSAEAELIALDVGVKYVLYLREFLKFQGHVLGHTVIREDNKSTMAMIKVGKPTTTMSRHIKLRYYHASDYVKIGILTLEYCPTQ